MPAIKGGSGKEANVMKKAAKTLSRIRSTFNLPGNASDILNAEKWLTECLLLIRTDLMINFYK